MYHFVFSLCMLTAPGAPAAPGVQVIAYIGTPCRAAQHAHVDLPELARHEYGDEHGRVVLNDLPLGTHRLTVWTIGWQSISTEVVMTHTGEALVLMVDLESGSVARVRPTLPIRSGGNLTDPANTTRR